MTWEELGCGSIGKHFSDLVDPRVEHTKQHQLLDIIPIAICGVVCGVDSWVDLELSAIPNMTGSSSFSACQAAFHPMTSLAGFLLAWTPRNSPIAS